MGTETLGIDVGSTNVKLCLVEDGAPKRSEILAHDGNVGDTVKELMSRLGIDGAGAEGPLALPRRVPQEGKSQRQPFAQVF